DLAVAVHLAREAAPELDARPDDERAVAGDEETETGAEVHRPLELDVAVQVGRLDGEAAGGRGPPAADLVAQPPGQPAQAGGAGRHQRGRATTAAWASPRQ